jgi:hypothetical protein
VEWHYKLTLQNIDPEDHATLDTLALGAEAGSGGSRTLADIIFDRLNGDKASQAMEEEGRSSLRGANADCVASGPPDPRKGLNPKVIEAYTKCVTVRRKWNSTNEQSRIPVITLQVWSATQSTQNSTIPPTLGSTCRIDRTYQMDPTRLLCLYKDFRLEFKA